MIVHFPIVAQAVAKVAISGLEDAAPSRPTTVSETATEEAGMVAEVWRAVGNVKAPPVMLPRAALPLAREPSRAKARERREIMPHDFEGVNGFGHD